MIDAAVVRNFERDTLWFLPADRLSFYDTLRQFSTLLSSRSGVNSFDNLRHFSTGAVPVLSATLIKLRDPSGRASASRQPNGLHYFQNDQATNLPFLSVHFRPYRRSQSINDGHRDCRVSGLDRARFAGLYPALGLGVILGHQDFGSAGPVKAYSVTSRPLASRVPSSLCSSRTKGFPGRYGPRTPHLELSSQARRACPPSPGTPNTLASFSR